MIFRRYSTIQSTKNVEEVKRNLLGQHMKVHHLDFEVSEKEGDIKIIPHAENEDHIYTLPITRVKLLNKNNGCTIKIMSKPRRIDIGGPYLIILFVFFALIAAILLYIFGKGQQNFTMYLLLGLAILTFMLLWFRLEMGYFDYIRKIHKWVKGHI